MSKLYKYVALGVRNSKRRRYTRDIFVNSRLFMPNYLEMNDPMEAWYECGGLTRPYIDDIRAGKPNLKMCCLSQSNSDVLMWAHYGDRHKGLCVEVEVQDTNVSKHKISYVKELPQLEGEIDINSALIQIMSHKLLPWQYEQEVRYLRTIRYGDTTPQYLSVHITKVFIGCWLNESEVNDIKRLLHSWNPSVIVEQIQRNELTFWNKSKKVKLF